jgi:uncharacterized protein YneF (UPF0154 family)
MFVVVLVLITLGVIVGLLASLIGLIGWTVLKLMKEELHLDIKINSEDKPS